MGKMQSDSLDTIHSVLCIAGGSKSLQYRAHTSSHDIQMAVSST